MTKQKGRDKIKNRIVRYPGNRFQYKRLEDQGKGIEGVKARKCWKQVAAVLLSTMLLSQSFTALAEEGNVGQNTGTETEASIEPGTPDDSQAGDAGENGDTGDNTEGNTGDAETEPEAPEVSGPEEGAGTENQPIVEPQETEQKESTEQMEEEVSNERKAQSAGQVTYTLQYEAHVQDLGWQDPVSDGKVAGTTGRAKRLEAVRIKVLKETTDPQTGEKKTEEVKDAIMSRAHSQDIGWMSAVPCGEIAGTTGRNKGLEALELKLSEELAKEYDLYYYVHCSDFGNLGWARNGQTAGTTGYARAIEALTIRLIKKGEQAPALGQSWLSPTSKGTVTYSAHVQDIGWMDSVADGKVSGTQGRAKHMEALRIYLTNPVDENGNKIEGSVEYDAHSQDVGWQNGITAGNIGGTTGRNKKLEAMRIRLTGAVAQAYDIYYRAHCSDWGTMGWAKNGETSGTVGYNRSIESIEIKVLPKGSSDAPKQEGRAALDIGAIGKFSAAASVPGSGWQNPVGNRGTIGTTGKGKAIEALKLQISSDAAGAYSGGISYKVHMQDTGWSKEAADGAEAGAPKSGKRMEAVQIKLTGELAKYCDVYYSAHVEEYGWLGWAANGQTAGTTNCAYRLEALKIVIQPKGLIAPGSRTGYHKTEKKKTRYDNAIDVILRSAGRDLYSCYRWVVTNLRYQTLPIPMDPPAGYTREQGYAIYAVENRRGNCYCYAAAFAGAAKALGYDARLIEGRVGMAAGGTGPHGWVEIVVNGTTYVCDPDGEAELKMNFYMVTYGSAGLVYYK